MDKNIVLEWFRFADTDLTAAEYLCSLYPQPIEIICYHCQQAAEKYLKGYLIYKGVLEPPKIHNLDVLCDMCEVYDISFDAIQKYCETLTLYGVQPRYPHEVLIEESDMHKAIEYAKQIEPMMRARKDLEQ